MLRPTRDAIQSYMSITGASESLAIQRLEEHGNNLTEAVNGHFRDVERSIVDPNFDSRSEYNVVEVNDQVRVNESRPVNESRQVNVSRAVPGGLPSLLSAARAFRPSLLLDPNYRRNLLRQFSGSNSSGNPSPSSHSGEVTGFPAQSTWVNDQTRPPGLGEVGDGYARHSSNYGSQVPGGMQRDAESPVYSNDVEEEMIRAAIEASKKDLQEGRHNTRYNSENDAPAILSPRDVINREDEDIARAISMSLEMEEQENALREQLAEFMPHDPCQSNTNESSRYEPGSSSVQDNREVMKQQQQIDTSFQQGHDLQNVVASYPQEWGGIPSKELQEAIMLEKALFGGVAKESASHNNQPGIHMESQSPDKSVTGEKPERSSTAKETALPIEPSVENEDAITLLVRMPDSSRHGRRFLKSDKLKYLFDFIDAAGLIKPGTYRVIRPYPRRAFSLQDGALTFEELSLTNKQEALFLELLV